MGCICLGDLLICGSSRHPIMWPLVNYGLNHCVCGPETTIVRYEATKDISYGPSSKSADSITPTAKKLLSPVRNPTERTHTCFAPPVSLFYWHLGDCGTRLPFKAKRDLAQQRRGYYLNATVRFASSNKATAAPGPLPGLAA